MKKFVISMIGALLLFSTCKDNKTEDLYIKIDKTSYEIGYSDTEVVVKINSNTSWKVAVNYPSGVAPFVTDFAPASSDIPRNVTFTLDPNPSGSPRTATVTVASQKAGDAPDCVFTIVQGASGPAITVTGENIANGTLLLDDQAGAFSIAVVANVDWTIDDTDASWITFNPKAGAGDLSTATVTGAFSENPSNENERTGSIKFMSGGEVLRTLPVKQIAGAFVQLTSNNIINDVLTLGGTQGSCSIDVVISVAWTIEVDAAWLTFTPQGGTGGLSVTTPIVGSYSTNPSTETPRTGNIKFMSGEKLMYTLPVTQAAWDGNLLYNGDFSLGDWPNDQIPGISFGAGAVANYNPDVHFDWSFGGAMNVKRYEFSADDPAPADGLTHYVKGISLPCNFYHGLKVKRNTNYVVTLWAKSTYEGVFKAATTASATPSQATLGTSGLDNSNQQFIREDTWDAKDTWKQYTLRFNSLEYDAILVFLQNLHISDETGEHYTCFAGVILKED